MAAEAPNPEVELWKAKCKTMIDPEDILDLMEPLADAMELSYTTYSNMLKLGPGDVKGQLFDVERIRDDLHYSSETVDKLDPGKHRNIVILHFL